MTYKSDSTQSFEIGSKNNFGNVVRVAASVYYIKWNDIQQNVFVSGNCGLQFTDNLGTAVAKGFDLQADGRVLAAQWKREADDDLSHAECARMRWSGGYFGDAIANHRETVGIIGFVGIGKSAGTVTITD